ncbi:type 2 lanthipeptide synthetase LanM family protein [Longimicrobium sp.]|uniref:type 2 lanthipeptide synthetase LanM family protein n=1 Tax=Longimicrobium sp. TaxID=2029185 RepID=UPI002E35BD89|nr:type 2 lanthipeptide synthetase LanM family protein [Longimicrobium sp.]HEX6042087.1 type 2 lanthipeptide synthetase LanM family protein [Longimicrobium sp.]
MNRRVAPEPAEAWLRLIAARAMSLRERADALRIGQAPSGDPRAADLLMQRWRKCFGNEPEAFAKRLSWDGLSEETALSILGSVPVIREAEELPRWTKTFSEYRSAAQADLASAPDPSVRSEEPLAFEDLLLPFVRVARRALQAAAGRTIRHLAPRAEATFERALLKRLCWVAERTLGLEFSVHRATRNRSGPEPNSAYREFVDLHLGEGFLALAEVYPVLARLLATATDQWVDTQAEMLRRLEVDHAELTRVFGCETPLGEVVAARPLLSDYHNGGRSVSILEFASGTRIVYKPKNVELEACWNQLLEWANSQGVSLSLRTFKVLCGDGYGWAEHVEATLYRENADIERFSRRAGMLVFVAYLLDANDLHHENVIRCGDNPVIVDLETLLHPWVAHPTGDAIDDPLRDSVLRSGLLPGRKEPAPGAADFSGLRAGPPPAVVRPIHWTAINSDAMLLSEQRPCFVPAPQQSGREWFGLEPRAVKAGFEEMYRLFHECRELLLAPESVLRAFASRSVRFVFRPTADYGQLLTGSLKPAYMRDGAARSVYLDAVTRAASPYSERPCFWPLIKSEIHDLERMDVPLFFADADSTDVSGEHAHRVMNYFCEPGTQRVLGRLATLNEQGLATQLGLIRQAMDCQAAAKS